MKRRSVFAVITATPEKKEQNDTLMSIIAEAQKHNIDVAVFSNIYNPSDTTDVLERENDIYELILSEEIDGFILLSESIINADVEEKIRLFLSRTKCPVISIGAAFSELNTQRFKHITTDDVRDFEFITDHMIEQHGFTSIDFLSGHSFMETSHRRVEGYRKSLESHGIAFDENRVHYGDFWINSGSKLAEDYLSGKKPVPQAVICANDHMAYGFMDTLSKTEPNPYKKIAVVGYGYSGERLLHRPLLTTYERSNRALGEAAVQLLVQRKENGVWDEWSAPICSIVPGDSCGCSVPRSVADDETHSLQQKNMYDFVNLYNQLDHRLTECTALSDFTRVCRSFQYQVRNASEIFFCLFEDWSSHALSSERMICYTVSSESDAFSTHKLRLSAMFSGAAAAYYFSPLFFASRSLGYAVIKYTEPDGYDPIYRNWLKSISTGLEVLRMKNDIQYLMQCQNLLETVDSLTGLRNKSGVERAYLTVTSSAPAPTSEKFLFTVLKTCLFRDEFTDSDKRHKVSSILDAADAIKHFAGSESLCGRTDDNTFVALMPAEDGEIQGFDEHLGALLLGHRAYFEHYGTDSFLSATVNVHAGECFTDLFSRACDALEQKLNRARRKRATPGYSLMLRIRNSIYMNPTEELSIEHFCKQYAYSAGHIRAMYRECFEISFHRDCICSRITMAKNLLCLSEISVSEISKLCGYNDSKYFFRQFRLVTGLSATQYRELFRRNGDSEGGSCDARWTKWNR